MPTIQHISKKLKRLFSWHKNKEEILTFSPVPFPELWLRKMAERSASLLSAQFDEIIRDLSNDRFIKYHDILKEKAQAHQGLYIPNIALCWKIDPENLFSKLHSSLQRMDYVIQNSKRIEIDGAKNESHWHFYYKPNAYKAASGDFKSYGNIKLELATNSSKSSLKIVNTYYMGSAYKQTQDLELLLQKLLGNLG